LLSTYATHHGMVKKILWSAMMALLPLLLGAQGRPAYEALFQDAPLEEVFRTLEKKYPLKFAYDLDAVSDVRINQYAKAGSIKDFLDQVFRGTGLVFQIPGEGQVLVRREIQQNSHFPAEFIQIHGQVTDALTGTPLAFAHILYEKGEGVAADEQGHFECRIPAPDDRRTTLSIQYIGYQPRELTIEGGRQDKVSLKVRLVPKVEKLPGITVKEKAPVVIPKNTGDGTMLRGARLSSIGNFYGGKDIFRGIQMLPGVDASNDLSSDISIRSSNGDENLVLLDGMTLYNVTHFFGIFSLVNPNIVSEVKVYKNAFPAQYGGRTAAVIDMQTQPMRQEGFKAVVDLNFLTSSAAIEIPIGPKMALLAGFRSANRNLGESALFGKTNPTTETEAFPNLPPGRNTATTISSQQPSFYFNDANLKWTWEPSAKTALRASLFRGRDRFDYNFTRSIYPPFRKPNTFLQEKYLEETHWQNDGASAEWTQEWGRHFRSSTLLSFSAYENSTLISNNFNRMQESSPLPGLQFENKHFNRVEEINVQHNHSWSLPKGQILHAGYQGAFSHTAFNIGEDGRSPLNGDRWGPQHSGYVQYLSGSTLKNVSADIGLRTTFFEGKSYFSPRIFLDFKPVENLRIKASFGRYQQFVRQLYHEDRFGRSFQYWVLSEKRFPIAVSDNLMLGFTHKNSWFDLDVEFYSKNTDGVLEHAQQRVGLPTVDGKPALFKYTLFQGKGYIKGVDILLQKSFSKTAFWAAYTLSKSTHTFPQVYQGNPFPSPNDRRHQLKLNAQYTVGKFDFGATYIFASGRPYTDLSSFDSADGDRNTLSPSERLEYLDDYHRIDLFGNFTFPLAKGEGKAGINLFNLLDRENVKYRQFIYSFITPFNSPGPKPNVNTVVGTELEMMGFTPNINLTWTF
jgi:ferric enterobactin receptor